MQLCWGRCITGAASATSELAFGLDWDLGLRVRVEGSGFRIKGLKLGMLHYFRMLMSHQIPSERHYPRDPKCQV